MSVTVRLQCYDVQVFPSAEPHQTIVVAEVTDVCHYELFRKPLRHIRSLKEEQYFLHEEGVLKILDLLRKNGYIVVRREPGENERLDIESFRKKYYLEDSP